MSTRQSTVDFLLDQLQSLRGVRARKMFGEYALYFEEKVVALVCDDQLFVKMTPPGKALVSDNYEEGVPYPGAKPAILVGADDLEDPERLAELIRVTSSALPAAITKPRSGTVMSAQGKRATGALGQSSAGAPGRTKRATSASVDPAIRRVGGKRVDNGPKRSGASRAISPDRHGSSDQAPPRACGTSKKSRRPS